MTGRPHLYAGAAIGLAAAAALGFAAARLTQPAAPDPATETAEVEAAKAPADTLVVSAQTIAASAIAVAPAGAGALDLVIPVSATIAASADAEAVLTSRAPGTVTRILRRIGDPVRAGDTVALVESREASQIAADRSAAAARVTLAARQLGRERTLLAQGVSPRADFETAQANLAVAQADARRAAAAAGAVRLAGDGRSVAVVSPIGGRITAVAAHLGQFVAAETELFRVADPRRLQVTASLPAADMARVRPGDRAELVVAPGRTVTGRVRAVTGVVDAQSRSATVVIVPDADTGALLPGQLIQARILASAGAADSAGAGGVTLPQDAVQTLGDRTVVFVRTRTGFAARPVRVGARSGAMVRIVSGLAAGKMVATTNAFLLKAELEKNVGAEE